MILFSEAQFFKLRLCFFLIVEGFFQIFVVDHHCSVTQWCPTLCDPMDCSTPGFPVLHHLLEFAQSHVHWVDDGIQPPHPLLFPSPPALHLSQHQGLFQWVSSSHQVAKFSSVQSLSRVRLFATPWIAARQASLFITISRSSFRLTSTESVMPSSHLILGRPLLLPPIPPSFRVFSNESTLRMRWYIYTMEYYSAIKKNTFESVLMRWMKLELIIQSEVSQKEKYQYSILTHIYGI